METKTRKYLLIIGVPVLLLLLPLLAVIMPNNDPQRLDLARTDFSGKLPIVYHPEYNITFFGMEKLHPFDSTKYAHVVNNLRREADVNPDTLLRPAKPPEGLVSTTHSARHLQSLRSADTLAEIAGLDIVATLPDGIAWNLLAEKMLYQSGGSIMAAQAALAHGWAINLGGGFHHASHDRGEGFCFFSDIAMIVHALRKHGHAQKFMIVDLDAHQGNGHTRDFMDDADVHILDAYNPEIYPQDEYAEKGITQAITLPTGTGDVTFLKQVEAGLDKAFTEFQPDMVIYVAGSDILAGDPLGRLDISANAVIQRDEMVFERALSRDIPVVMLFGGGYQAENAAVISDSILNLKRQFKLF